MLGSLLRTSILVWLSLWFGIILPGHERGVVRLPGGDRLACCPLTGELIVTRWAEASGSGANKPASESPGETGDSSRCAICQIVATLAVPPALTCYEPDPTPVSLLDQLPPAQVAVPFTFAAKLGRAPPAFFV